VLVRWFNEVIGVPGELHTTLAHLLIFSIATLCFVSLFRFWSFWNSEAHEDP
jgi:hypothetical protein